MHRLAESLIHEAGSWAKRTVQAPPDHIGDVRPALRQQLLVPSPRRANICLVVRFVVVAIVILPEVAMLDAMSEDDYPIISVKIFLTRVCRE